MSYFDSLLKKRGLEECPLPLWKLTITEEEFKDLRELLEKQTHVMSMCNNPFIIFVFFSHHIKFINKNNTRFFCSCC